MARYRLTPDERDWVHEMQIELGAIKRCAYSVAHAAGVWQPVVAFEDYGDAVCTSCVVQARSERGRHAAGTSQYARFAQSLARGQGWNEIPT